MSKEGQILRRPKYTVLANLKRKERTDWIGSSIEFFDHQEEATKCYDRHRAAGDMPIMRPFHTIDEQHLHVLDSRKQADPEAEVSTSKVHILRNGLPLCGFTADAPNRWPEGHLWISTAKSRSATCEECKKELARA